jgi:hypothetical protein
MSKALRRIFFFCTPLPLAWPFPPFMPLVPLLLNLFAGLSPFCGASPFRLFVDISAIGLVLQLSNTSQIWRLLLRFGYLITFYLYVQSLHQSRHRSRGPGYGVHRRLFARNHGRDGESTPQILLTVDHASTIVQPQPQRAMSTTKALSPGWRT